MKKMLLLLVVLCLGIGLASCYAEKQFVLIDDFEGEISGTPTGTVDFGAGNGSTVEVTASTDIKQSGNQSLKVTFDAVPDGYMWVARGQNLDAQNAGWLLKTEDIAWEKFEAISFYMHGNNSGADVAFDIKDSGNEIWRFMVKDDFTGWKQIICAFDAFYVRNDWQPDSADKNGKIDYPIKSYQFEPRTGKGTLYFDCVALIEK
jgi:hypothetical protein